MSKEPVKYTQERILLCEGVGDKRFFERLIVKRDLPGYQVEQLGGRNQLRAHLSGMKVASGFEGIRGVLVVSDNDDDPTRSFNEVTAQIEQAGGYPIPSAPFEVAGRNGFPFVAVLMLPFVEETTHVGNLESLCLGAMTWQPELRVALDAFVAQSAAGSWGVGKKAKARAQCLAAVTCKRSPSSAFLDHFYHNPECIVSVQDQCFGGIAQYLIRFATVVALRS